MIRIIETFCVLLFSFFIETQGGEVVQKASLRNLYTARGTFLIDQTHSSKGGRVFRQLQLRLVGNWVPDNSSITVIEEPVSHNRMSRLRLVCNSVPIGGAWLSHEVNRSSEEIVDILFRQLQWYRGHSQRLYPDELYDRDY